MQTVFAGTLSVFAQPYCKSKFILLGKAMPCLVGRCPTPCKGSALDPAGGACTPCTPALRLIIFQN